MCDCIGICLDCKCKKPHMVLYEGRQVALCSSKEEADKLITGLLRTDDLLIESHFEKKVHIENPYVLNSAW